MAVDPRRFPGLFFLHVLLIVLLLAVGCAAVALRSVGSPSGARASTGSTASASPLAQGKLELLSA